MRYSTYIRWAVRILFLAAAVALSLGGPLPVWLAKVFPALSPLTVLSSLFARRAWYVALAWTAPPLVLIALAFWKGPIFCRWICPAGTLYSIPARLSLKKTILPFPISGAIFWTIIFASALGTPLFLFLDPLAAFNRLTPLLKGIYSAAWLVPGLMLPLFLVLGFIQPMLWCSRLCPLGYLFEACRRARGRAESGVGAPDQTRRDILTGLLIGAPLAAVARNFFLARSSYARAPVLPPGAKNQKTFASLCSRCYACIGVCPEKVIRVGFPADRAVGQLFQPELDLGRGYCEEFCNNCTQVCPTGALSPLTIQEKRHRQIGIARITKSACLAWSDGEYCMVCREYCPYDAILSDFSQKGIPRPVVKEDVCRGCGLCQNQCPAVREGKAIIVHGVAEQRQLAPPLRKGEERRRDDPVNGYRT